MGMSASQVRFLSLQHRKHNVGRQLNALSNRKMSLARDMQTVSRNYTNALNQINLKFSNNCGINTYALNYDLLMKPNALNCETPYIITDREGRVVVDDNEVTYEKNGETVHTGVSYRQLAQLISSYTDVDNEGNVIYGATDRLANFSGELFGENGYSINKAATSGLACGVENGYKIAMKSSDYDYGMAMRYDILNRLGIVTNDNFEEFGAIQKAYFGTKEARDNNLYSTVAINDTKGTTAYYEEQLAIKALNEANKDDAEYQAKSQTSEIFGALQITETGALTIEGGCTLGNLELAKKYLEELDLYLNTDIKQKATPSSMKYDTSDVTTNITDEEYLYEHFLINADTPKEGITNRFIDLLTRPTSVDSDGNNVFADEVDTDGFYKKGVDLLSQVTNTSAKQLLNAGCSYTTTGTEKQDPYYNGWGGSTNGRQCPGLYNNGYSDPFADFGWFQGDGDGGYNTPRTWSSFFSSNSDTEMDTYAVITGFYNDGDDSYVDAKELFCNGGNITTILRSFSNSLSSSGNIKYDEDAARYAETMTYIKFANNFRLFEWGADYVGDGTGGLEKAVQQSLSRQLDHFDVDRSNSASKEEYQIHAQNVYYSEVSCSPTKQTVWSAEQMNNGANAGMNGVVTSTSDDADSDACAFAVSIPNLINTYITFYTAYIEAQKATGTQPVVAWKSYNNMYTSTTEGWSEQNVRNDICDGWSEQSRNYSIAMPDENGNMVSYTSFVLSDADNNGRDDKTGFINSLFKQKVFEGVEQTVTKTDENGNSLFDENGNRLKVSTGLVVDKKYGVTRNVYTKLQAYSGTIDSSAKYDAFLASLSSNSERLEIEKLVYKTNSEGKFVDSDGNVLANQNDKSARVALSSTNLYGELNNLIKGIQQKVYDVKQDTAVPTGAKKYVEIVSTNNFGTYTGTATSKYDLSAGANPVLLERVVNYEGALSDGFIQSYNEKLDNDGNRVASIEYLGETSDKLANIQTGSGAYGRQNGGVTVCQITAGDNTYVITGNEVGTNFANYLYTKPTDDGDLRGKLKDLVKRLEEQAAEQERQMQKGFNNIENKVMEYFDTLFKRISENGWVYDEKVNTSNTKASANYLNTMLQNNQYLLTEAKEINENGRYQYAMKQATSVNKIYQVHDEDAENAAFAVYESEKTAISNKEKQIDKRMSMLETEQEVINTELESIKKVRNDNIDKYFKIFA